MSDKPKTIDELLKEVEAKVVNKGNEVGQAYSLSLKVSLAQDYCWQTIAEIHIGGMETGDVITIEQWGKSAEHALYGMLTKLDEPIKKEDKLWKEIMLKAINEEGHGISAIIDTYTLRIILENHNLLPKTKDGM